MDGDGMSIYWKECEPTRYGYAKVTRGKTYETSDKEYVIYDYSLLDNGAAYSVILQVEYNHRTYDGSVRYDTAHLGAYLFVSDAQSAAHGLEYMLEKEWQCGYYSKYSR